MHRNASRFAWAMIPIPLVIFDCIVILVGLYQVICCYEWLLPSERLLRVLLLWGLLSRVLLGLSLSMYVFGNISLDVLIFVSVGSYLTSTLLNIRRHSAYTWVKLQSWDLLILLQLLTFRLHALYPRAYLAKGVFSTACKLVWPSILVAVLYVGFVILMCVVVMRDDSIWRVAAVRTLSRLFLLQAVCTAVAVISFSKWLGAYVSLQHAGQISAGRVEGSLADLVGPGSGMSQQETAVWVVSGLVSFVLLLVLACFASICFIGRHAHLSFEEGQEHTPIMALQDQNRSSVTHSTKSTSILAKDMQLTLERVSNHFYRILVVENTSAVKGNEFSEGFVANSGSDGWSGHTQGADLEQGPQIGLLNPNHQPCLYGSCTDAPPIEELLRRKTTDESEGMLISADFVHSRQPCAPSVGSMKISALEGGPEKQKSATQKSSVEEDPNAMCIICFQNVRGCHTVVERSPYSCQPLRGPHSRCVISESCPTLARRYNALTILSLCSSVTNGSFRVLRARRRMPCMRRNLLPKVRTVCVSFTHRACASENSGSCEDSELCRNGVCPTCRSPLHGVLELEPPIDKTGEKEQGDSSEKASFTRYCARVRAVSP